ncbi:hypothetical protein [Jongsikchunia kroppenstedtii]|uniref:hypothetical protein n=1 Tax=Jongsikchunia kroppenstedtii TaxID=1121721 RepID=UPI00037F74B8|nr:hypothetical protein [Jongsikchunia kroppenstedtii]
MPEPDDAPATDQTDQTAESPDEPDTTTAPEPATKKPAAGPDDQRRQRALLIGVSAVAVIATVLAIVFGVLYGQQSSKADKNARTAAALQTRQDSYAKAIAAATEFATTQTTTPVDGNWTKWQSEMRSLVGPGMQDRYTDAKVAKVRSLGLHTTTTVSHAGVTAARPGSCDVLVVAATTDATAPQSAPAGRILLLTVDEATNRITKIS